MPSSSKEFSGTDSDSDSDYGFNEDMEALKRACQLTDKNPVDHQLQLPSTSGAAASGVVSASASSETESDGEGEDDLQLVRSIQNRFAISMDIKGEPPMKPLCASPPDWSDTDDCEEDYETLRVIQRRFASYNDGGLKDNVKDLPHRDVQVGGTVVDTEKETSSSFVERTNAREKFLNCVDTSEHTGKKSEACGDAGGRQPDSVEWNGPDADDVDILPLKSSQFPKSALAFVDAIKKNRSCQKLIRSKMMQMEARMEELNKLIERVKILKDFQVACKKRTGRALSQKKDARVQLISVPRLKSNMKLNEKKIPALYKGPPENLHVAKYKEALATFAVSVSREKWSKEERENLVKGVKQQFQGMLLQRSVDLLSESNGSHDSGNVDSIIVSIKELDITPEKIRSFLPKVNWKQLAAMYVPSRSAAECQARFLNCEDPLINHNPWTAMEDKNLLHIVQQKGLSNWIDIAASLGTNRTPFQCLVRYQRSLNASILKREWTKVEDNQLRAAVETYGESNWQLVASAMEGRTGTQCSNRWLKTLNPARKRVGKWTAEEDKCLKVAVTLFGPKTWTKVAKYVTGRTQVQCRERWVNCLDPNLNTAEWTEEEDSKLEAAIKKHGYCWSKVAACIPHRTDNLCWRRWKVLFPNQVPLHQAARKIQRAALISNFVDRESERPALGPNDFLLPETCRFTGCKNADPFTRKKRRSREICLEKVAVSTNGNEFKNLQNSSMPEKERRKSSRLMKKNGGPSSHSHFSPSPDTVLLDLSNGEEIRESSANDNKKKPSVKSKPVDDSLMAGPSRNENTPILPQSKEHGCPNPTYECSLPEPVRDDATQSKKTSKLHPRRRQRDKTLAEVDRQAEGETILKTKKDMKKKKKQTDATNDHLSSFPHSMPVTDFREEIEEIAPNQHLGTGNLEDFAVSSAGDNEQQHTENAMEDENVTLASFLVQSRADSTQIGSSSIDVSVPNQRKRRRNEEESCPNQVLEEVEAGDDTTLAQFYDELKKRRNRRSQGLTGKQSLL